MCIYVNPECDVVFKSGEGYFSSDSSNEVRIREKEIGGLLCVSDLLIFSGIEWDSSGGWLTVPIDVFQGHLSNTKMFKPEEVVSKRQFVLHYTKKYSSIQLSAPIEFIAYLLEKAEFPFIIIENKVWIQM